MYSRGRSYLILGKGKCKVTWKVFIVIALLLTAGVSSVSYGVNGQVPDETPAQVHLTARFILWDTYEKMIDNNFTVHILTFNNTTLDYNIEINNIIYSGNVTYYAAHTINATAEKINIKVSVNGTEVFSGDNIVVMRDVTGGQINRGRSQFTINLLPSEWTRREWSVFTALLTALLVILPITYRGVKMGRKVRGVKEIK